MSDPRELEALSEEELVRRGVAAARVGESGEARRLLEEVVARNRDHAEAHLWLAGLVDGPRAKAEHFRRVLELRPGDEDAARGLARLEEKFGPGVAADDTNDPVFCTWHPDRETLLRCTRCGRAMCTECAVRHPVGMRCRQCVKELRSPIFVVSPTGLTVAGTTALIAGAMAGVLLAILAGFRFGLFMWLIAFFVGSAAGATIAELASRTAGRKRGNTLSVVVAVALAVGVLSGRWALQLAQYMSVDPQVPFAAAAGAAFAAVLADIVLLGIFLFGAIGAVLRTLR